MVLKKFDIQSALAAENRDVKAGRLREESPLDLSDDFNKLCEACRRGDLRTCQEQISKGANINARDRFDYTPLILASLCGHFEVAQHLLDSGALCERDTFQGERCLYNALNDRIRNLLLSYDYSKSTNPLQPLAAHITSLLSPTSRPRTSDIALCTATETFELHKFILAARSSYFATLLAEQPNLTRRTLARQIPASTFGAALRYIYLAEAGLEVDEDEDEQEILRSVERVSRQLDVPGLFDSIVDAGDRRRARQRRTDEIDRAQRQLAAWFEGKIVGNKMEVETERAEAVRWDRENGIFADVLLRADFALEDDDDVSEGSADSETSAGVARSDTSTPSLQQDGANITLPIGLSICTSNSTSPPKEKQRSVLFPAHRAMLTRSPFFSTMFASPFREGEASLSCSPYLSIIPLDCSPPVLEIVLRYLYTESADNNDFGLDLAVDVLFAAEMLLLDKLKARAALVISTLGSADIVALSTPPHTSSTTTTTTTSSSTTGAPIETLDIYDVIRAAWLLRVPRLEEFGARYLAYGLERHIETEEFAELVRESAERIKVRQETDTVELVDDVRYYLSERFRLRFEETGIGDLIDQEAGEGEGDGSREGEGTVGDGLAVEKEGVVDDDDDDNDDGFGLYLQDAAYTLDGELAGDEFAQDALRYRMLLGKIDSLLEKLKLDA